MFFRIFFTLFSICFITGKLYKYGEEFEHGCQTCTCSLAGTVTCLCNRLGKRKEIRDLTDGEKIKCFARAAVYLAETLVVFLMEMQYQGRIKGEWRQLAVSLQRKRHSER